MTRRTCLALLTSAWAAPAAAPKLPKTVGARLPAYLEAHRRPEGGYGWSSDVTPHVTPTFGVVGSYRLLGLATPKADAVGRFVRETYPVNERRRTDRPLGRLDFEQVQTLAWLGESIESFRELASTWQGPAEFTTRYELGGNPVLQHQAMAVRVRGLLAIPATPAWNEYFLARRRPDGTFNNTPAEDGSGGHVMNTLWGYEAVAALGLELPAAPALADWVRSCMRTSGGYGYMPRPEIGGAEDITYTWCALQLLQMLKAKAESPELTAQWISSLLAPEGGFQDRAGGAPNPLATFFALDSLRLLGLPFDAGAKPASLAREYPLPRNAKVFSIQIEAPGAGSPREAVLLAKTLGIHIWAAKNSPPGWIEETQRIAGEQKVAVTFAVGDEEYGTYVELPGLGCYSHLVDLAAPYGNDFGKQLPKKEFPYPWQQFRDGRLDELQSGDGRLFWQFNENEELTRILLDEAVEMGTYAGIASFHFGNENFLHSQPYLHRWYERLPFVGLQDAHGRESWWWGNQLAGFTTLFIATEPTWDAWLEALERRHVMAVRHDAVSGWKTHLAGGSNAVRRFVKEREAEWRWWDDGGAQARRPAGALTVLRPGMRFEAGAPESGLALRLRLWQENTGRGVPDEPRAALLELTVDGRKVEPQLVESPQDRYYLAALEEAPGEHAAEARIRLAGSGREVSVKASWTG
jgi:hypothetical protein